MVGDFTGNWKEPLKAKHRGGSRHEVEVKLPQGKYVCDFNYNSLYMDSKSIISKHTIDSFEKNPIQYPTK